MGLRRDALQLSLEPDGPRRCSHLLEKASEGHRRGAAAPAWHPIRYFVASLHTA
jgi:hypothetical protein